MPITPATATTQFVERHSGSDLARTGRRERHDDRHRREALRPSAAGPAAPGVLRLPLRRAGPAAAPAARAGQVPLPRRLVEHLLRPPVPGRGALRGGRPADVRGAGGLARRCSPRRARSATTTPTRSRAWWSRSTTTCSSGWCSRRSRPDPEEVGDTAFVTAGRAGGAACEGPVLGLVHDRAGRGAPGGPGADGPVRGLVTAAAAVGVELCCSGQRRPDDLAAARRVLDVADPARLPGDLADQEQTAAAGLAVVGLQGGGAVGVVVLDGDPHPLGADGDLHGERRARAPPRAGPRSSTSSETISSSPCTRSSGTGTPCRSSRSRTACRACGTEASTAGAVNLQTPS